MLFQNIVFLACVVAVASVANSNFRIEDVSLSQKDDGFGGGFISSPCNFTQCGGAGKVIDIRVCESEVCELINGQPCDVEVDFQVSAPAQSLSLAVEFCTSEICSVIIRVELPNSSVYPDFVYTAKYTIVGNDLPVVQYGSIRSYLFNKGTGLAEICVEWNFSL